jgi:hypothetical protein
MWSRSSNASVALSIFSYFALPIFVVLLSLFHHAILDFGIFVWTYIFSLVFFLKRAGVFCLISKNFGTANGDGRAAMRNKILRNKRGAAFVAVPKDKQKF